MGGRPDAGTKNKHYTSAGSPLIREFPQEGVSRIVLIGPCFRRNRYIHPPLADPSVILPLTSRTHVLYLRRQVLTARRDLARRNGRKRPL